MAHLNYGLDLCVDTYIVNNGAVLLRLHDKYDYWGAPGGHINPGEDVNEASLREVWEEVGLRVELVGPKDWQKQGSEHNQDLVPPIFINRHRITDTHEHSAFIFVARATLRDVNPQLQEDIQAVENCLWLTMEELTNLKEKDSRLGDDTYRYAVTALELVL